MKMNERASSQFFSLRFSIAVCSYCYNDAINEIQQIFNKLGERSYKT